MVESKIVDFVVQVMRAAITLHLDRFVHIIRRKITLKPNFQLKVRCQLSRSVFLSVAGVSGEGREMETLTVFKDDKSATGYEIPFLMDTGAKCIQLPVDVYKQVSGEQQFNFLYACGKSALILANVEEHPIGGKAPCLHNPEKVRNTKLK